MRLDIGFMHNRHRTVEYQNIALTFLFSAFWVGFVFLTTPITPNFGGFDADGGVYGAMAGEPSFSEAYGMRAPWCYRILTPYLASILPFQILTNFRILSFFSNIFSLVILERILRIFDFAPLLRVFGILLYAGSFWTLKFSSYSPAYIDYQTQLFLLLILYTTLRQKYFILPFVFTLAVLQKESLAAYTLFSVIHLLRYGGNLNWKKKSFSIATIFIFPFMAILIVRVMIEPLNAHSPLVIFHFIQETLKPTFWPILLQAVFSGTGIISILLIVHYQSWLRFLWHCWEWIIYIMISLIFLFGGVDKARLFLYVLPVVVILAVYNAELFRGFTTSKRFILWFCVVLVVHGFMGGYLTPMGSFESYLARMVPVHSDGTYVPYLIRNLILGCFVFVLTVQLIMNEWYFCPKEGFTKRVRAIKEGKEPR